MAAQLHFQCAEFFFDFLQMKSSSLANLSYSILAVAWIASALSGCGGGGGGGGSAPSSSGGALNASQKSGTWAWIGGSNTASLNGTYGIQGLPSVTNIPGARESAATWVDGKGSFWLFGGTGKAESNLGFLNDLWRYDPTTGLWTWMSGSNRADAVGVYGSVGIASQSNTPSARRSAIALTAANGDLWLFGGAGIDPSTGKSSLLNDLWKYSMASGQWTWVKGDPSQGLASVSAGAGTFSSANRPSARALAMGWLDSAGNLWIYGGAGYHPTGDTPLDDMWKFDVNLGQWALMRGSGPGANAAIYGTRHQESATNTPGTRYSGLSWTDKAGNLWLFGGDAYPQDATGSSRPGLAGDLWRFNPTSGQWAWVAGSKLANALGVYGTKGVSSASTAPGARFHATSWADSSGRLWLYGGNGWNSSSSGNLSDLWMFDTSTLQWTWVNGSEQLPTSGWRASVYGTAGVGAIENTPGSRLDTFGWADSKGGLWLFGGTGAIENVFSTITGDLWRFQN